MDYKRLGQRLVTNKGMKDREEWALVSTSSSNKVLKWFGENKPSPEEIEKEEKRVSYFKHRTKRTLIS